MLLLFHLWDVTFRNNTKQNYVQGAPDTTFSIGSEIIKDSSQHGNIEKKLQPIVKKSTLKKYQDTLKVEDNILVLDIDLLSNDTLNISYDYSFHNIYKERIDTVKIVRIDTIKIMDAPAISTKSFTFGAAVGALGIILIILILK